ncbi:DNA-binding transcriptional LysR family regulator [Alteromonadaceae bacterium 2753L.S.0a.02]|nr:DNA-binding transcriptional LysR family regulator [Alteromonadaceae bacterium 2753L.S.0a.02]
MAISLEQLRAFASTFENGSFTAAGRHLGKHSSSVGELVANLEIDTGLNLFQRSGRAISATDKAQQLYPYAKSVITEAEQFDAKVDSLYAEQPDRFTVAIDTAARGSDLVACYAQVRREYPAVELRVISGDAMQVISWVRSGMADLGIVYSTLSAPPDLHLSRAFNVRIVRVGAATQPLWQGTVNHLQLRGTTQIVHKFMLDAGLAEAHVEANHSIVCNNAHEVLEMVAADMGWAFMPVNLVQAAIDVGRLRVIDIEGAREDVWFTEIVRLATHPENPVMRRFVALVGDLPDR